MDTRSGSGSEGRVRRVINIDTGARHVSEEGRLTAMVLTWKWSGNANEGGADDDNERENEKGGKGVEEIKDGRIVWEFVSVEGRRA